jgi:hypothetical protein
MLQHLRRAIEIFASVPESLLLEQRILVGLQQEPARTNSRRRRQWVWLRPHCWLRSNLAGKRPDISGRSKTAEDQKYLSSLANANWP